MRHRKRIEELERQLTSSPIVLTMRDGSIRTISGRGNSMLNLLAKAVRGESSAELSLIKTSVKRKQADGGHLADLCWALLNGPVLNEESKGERTDVR